MGRIFDQMARCQALLFHFLLFATMLQGITPDQHSLASLTILHIFFSTQDFSNSLDDEDGEPEEEVLSTEPENRLVSRLLEWRMEDHEGLIVQGIGSDLLRFRCSPGNLLNSARLSILLCRLAC